MGSKSFCTINLLGLEKWLRNNSLYDNLFAVDMVVYRNMLRFKVDIVAVRKQKVGKHKACMSISFINQNSK